MSIYKTVLGALFVSAVLVGCGSNEPLSKEDKFIESLKSSQPELVSKSESTVLLELAKTWCIADPYSDITKLAVFVSALGKQGTFDLGEAVEASNFCE